MLSPCFTVIYFWESHSENSLVLGMKNENSFESFHEFLSIFQVQKFGRFLAILSQFLDDVNRDFDFLKNNRARFQTF